MKRPDRPWSCWQSCRQISGNGIFKDYFILTPSVPLSFEGEGEGIKKRGEAPIELPLLEKGFGLKVVIPVKTGIQFYIIRHDSWIPTCVGMTIRLRNGTYDTSPLRGEGEKIKEATSQPPATN
ncbi:MAG TPA: hypothetical protein G4O10_07400 [Dehalococcoidia bacterium]|nr:hypothetical protein [Dehalococcoidia bacterium]